MEKILLSTVLLLFFLAIVLLAVVIISNHQHEEMWNRLNNKDKEVIVPNRFPDPPKISKSADPFVCTTAGCVKASNNFINAMNTSVDPCDNFFEFSCGLWNEQHPIPDDKGSYNTFTDVRERLNQQVRVLLEKEVTSSSKSINMARIMYKSCMNKEKIEELKTGPLFESLSSLGNWPLLQENWQPENFKLTEVLANSRKNYGIEALFKIYIDADPKNTSRNTLYIDQSSLALGRGSRDYYLNTTLFAKQITAYRKRLQQIAILLKADANLEKSEESIKADIEKIIDFEIELAKIVVAEDDRRNSTRLYNKRSIQDLYHLMPQVDWISFFQQSTPSDITHLFHNGTEIIVCELEYLQKVSDLISRTDVSILTNYILWRVVHWNVGYLDKRFDVIEQDYLKVLTGQQQTPPKWKKCAHVPISFLPLAAGAIYVQAHFKENDKDEALRMITHIRNSFTELVKKNDWMDDETKTVAIEKANSMINSIGYPDVTNDLKLLDEEYRGLEINEGDSYYSIMKKSVIWMQSQEFHKLTKPFDKHEFDISPAVVNAFYSPVKNSITFPAGILQPPYFSGDFPKAVNYGAIGAVIGHEITHGFDDQGSQYDKDGNLHNWWSDNSFNAFDTRRKCIVEQYGNYTLPGTTFKVNGKLTQGENIADNGGVKEAFQAYQKYVAENGEEPRLPGLQHYTNEQIFFVSYAHFWCGTMKEATAIRQVLTDEHSPGVFRVNGVLSNMKEFAQAFNCPKNAPINPDHKCTVW